jgi:hypothetical protein
MRRYLRALPILTLTLFADAAYAKQIVFFQKTEVGEGATAEMAERVFAHTVMALRQLEEIELRTTSECDAPCEHPRYIISSEIRSQAPFFTIYFRIIDRERGIAANIRRLRVKDATFEELLELITPDLVKNFFVFQDAGGYSKSEFIEK